MLFEKSLRKASADVAGAWNLNVALSDEFGKKLAGVDYSDIKLTTGTKLHVHTGTWIEHPHFRIRSPFNPHLGCKIHKIDLSMKHCLCI